MKSARPDPVVIDDDALARLADYCLANGLTRLLMVADVNTYAAQGEAVEATLTGRGLEVAKVVFDSPEVVADAAHVLDALLASDPPGGSPELTYLAVGSGTLTDITRFVSHRTGRAFLSIPTAPSVDGFASIGAPLIIHGVKKTVISQPPRAIFADLHTLTAAPPAMIAAGFGDMLGKFTSVADWRLGHLLWDEPYDEAIAQRMLATAWRCAEEAEAIGRADPQGVRALMETLIESGFCMLDFGSSRPASGAEHHYSHFWEMTLLREGRPAILHGAKVGVATVLVAEIYAQIRQMSLAAAAARLALATLPDREDELTRIRAAYGDLTPEIAADQAPFLNLTAADFAELKVKILAHWDEIQAIAAQVPPPEEIKTWLWMAGGPVDVAGLGLTAEEQALAEANGHYLRQRFTVRKLMRVMGGA